MIAIGRYFVLIISLAGMTLSVKHRINEEDKNKFLDDIFILHNDYRQKHMVAKLKRTPEMDFLAARILDDLFIGQNNKFHDKYGMNIHEKMYNKYTKLNTVEAESIFLEWYSKGSSYNYLFETTNYEPYKEFTQILWQDTQMIGIALRLTNDKYVLQIVYYPRGNIPGQFENNVLQRPIIAHIKCAQLNRYIYENDKKNFEDYIVYLHNEARMKHRVPILQRDIKLDVFADFILKIISNKMNYDHDMYGNNYLEKIYDDNTLLDKAKAGSIFSEWYNMGKNYNYSVEPSKKKAAEFTQIVWKSTKKIGISMLREEGFYRVLVFYNPPGNIKGEFISNVLMPRFMEQGESSLYY